MNEREQDVCLQLSAGEIYVSAEILERYGADALGKINGSPDATVTAALKGAGDESTREG